MVKLRPPSSSSSCCCLVSSVALAPTRTIWISSSILPGCASNFCTRSRYFGDFLTLIIGYVQSAFRFVVTTSCHLSISIWVPLPGHFFSSISMNLLYILWCCHDFSRVLKRDLTTLRSLVSFKAPKVRPLILPYCLGLQLLRSRTLIRDPADFWIY